MLPRLALLPIGLFAVWCFVSHQWYVCHIKQKCPVTQVTPPPPPDTTTAECTEPITFKWSDPTPILCDKNFEAYRDSILKALPEGKLLEITGLYSEGEAAPQGFANMGLARGEAVKALLAKFLPPERIVVSSEQVPKPADAETKNFAAIRFGQRDAAPPPSTVECVTGAGGLTILFPYGKAQREVDNQIEKCLGDLVAHLKKTDDQVQITGHTDSAGSTEYNQELGMRRAEHLQGILVKQGIAKSRIGIDSKGETQPVASNDTEEGSRLNRRAVLVLKPTKPVQ
ncbi:MAG: OmpA family protein [Bacteroidota bacterium]